MKGWGRRGGGGENSDEEKRYKEMKMILEGGAPIFKKNLESTSKF